MALEVVGDWSVVKDFDRLSRLYHAAGVPEFWRVDARDPVSLEVVRWDITAYIPTQLPDGWWHSSAFGRDFHLTWHTDPLGQPRYTLQCRP